ncbi:MAG: hypothetical protein PVI90_00405 [Desulfobacteraceae bacterium]|jgi:hypothetical protein
MMQNKIPRPEKPETKESGPIIKLLGGSQAKSKGFSIQRHANQKDKQRYQNTKRN